jgi:tetratricopeptide (TPR) repeat protein
MRTAYGGRAAAYEKKGDLDRAVADYNMLVFSYAVELDVTDAKADGSDALLREAARAYRTRAACLQARGDVEAARRDVQRAENLETKARKADKEAKPAEAPGKLPGRVTVHNGWSAPVTLVIAEVRYTLQVGETRTLVIPAGSSPCEVEAGPHRFKGTLEAGGTYNIVP